MFCNAVHGKYKNHIQWVSREDFKALKQADPFIATIWSFGNNLSNYMYSAEIEPWKKALHYAIVFEDYRYIHQFGIDFTLLGTDSHTRRLDARKIIKENHEDYKKKYIEWYISKVLKLDNEDKNRLQSFDRLADMQSLESLERLERLQSLQSLQSLERLQSLQSLQSLGNNLIVYAKDYREIPITSNSVIYCDIPYKNTDAYVKQHFDYKTFYDWCCKQEVPVYVSEYTLDDDRFELVAEKEKRVLYSSNNRGKAVEKLFKVKGK